MITQTYNLIILDRSGSMETIRQQAIAGVNETIGTIRSIAKKNNMRQLVTLTSFCSCQTLDHYLNEDVDNVRTLTSKSYQPCCCTPLYDTIGNCCTRLKRQIGDRDDVAVSVTIITDGYENASREWTTQSVQKLIEELKEKGWLFAYIGANQNLDEIKYNLSINNTLAFEATAEGTEAMFEQERKSREEWAENVACCSRTFDCQHINLDYFKK
jgi:hypothetical protein